MMDDSIILLYLKNTDMSSTVINQESESYVESKRGLTSVAGDDGRLRERK